MNHLTFRRNLASAVLPLLLCACGTSADAPAQAETAAPQSPPSAAASAADAAQAGQASAALREFIDPVTGQPRQPTAAELQALEARKATTAPSSAINSKPRGKETVLPNGWVSVEVDAASEMKGCVQKDGRVVVGHDCKSDVAAPVAKP